MVAVGDGAADEGHRPEVGGGEGQRVQQLDRPEPEAGGVRHHHAPAQDACGAGEREGADRTDPGHHRGAEPHEEDDLAGDRRRPERADLGSLHPELPPVDRAERVDHGVARLQAGDGGHEEGEGRVHHHPPDLAQRRRRVAPHPVRPGMADGEGADRGHAGDHPPERDPAAVALHQHARDQVGGEEADRAHRPDRRVAEVPEAARRDPERLGDRADPRGRRPDRERRQEQRRLRGDPEMREVEQDREPGADDDRQRPAVQPVGDRGDREPRDHPHRDAERGVDADLARGETPVAEPDRPEGDLHPRGEEEREVEGADVHRRAARAPRSVPARALIAGRRRGGRGSGRTAGRPRARTRSSGVLMLKKGSSSGQKTAVAAPQAAAQSRRRRLPAASASASAARRSTGQRPKVGCSARPSGSRVAATAARAPSRTAADARRATRSRGRKGVSTAAVTTASAPCAAAHSRPARRPASGPAESGTPSAITGSPRKAKRPGSPLALIARKSTWGRSRSTTWATSGRPPSGSSALSSPPIRDARPPARMTPAIGRRSDPVGGIRGESGQDFTR